MLVHSRGGTNPDSQEILGASPEVEKLRGTIKALSSSKVPVLITGETGTGKELFARAIHDGDPQGGPFVAIDCGALPDSLMESEMFGHVKGAFTGADAPATGLLLAANGGTVFLDEVGEMTLANQVKLLRALQEKEVRPVGSSRTVSLNVRVIAASNRCLLEEVKARRFRNDLYFRLAVACINVPTLRSRRSDIRLLADYFLKKHGASQKTINSKAMSVIEAYAWPGNVRELEHCIEAACVLVEGNEIVVSDLPEAIQLFALELREGTEVKSGRSDPNGVLRLSKVEKRAIEAAIDFTNGNIPQAARELGIGKTTLYRRLKEYKI